MPSKHLCHGNMPNIRIASSDFTVAASSLCRGFYLTAGDREMREDPLMPATATSDGERKPLTAAAKRALAEAEARRKAAEANAKPPAKEFQAPQTPEPTPYRHWAHNPLPPHFS